MQTRVEELYQRFDNEPLAKLFSISLTRLEEGEADLVMRVYQEMTIVGEIAQGGVTTVLADYAAVYAAMSVISVGHTPCRNIGIHFLRPAKLGQLLVARAKVLNRSRSSILVKAEVRDQASGKLLVQAQLDFAVPPQPNFSVPR